MLGTIRTVGFKELDDILRTMPAKLARKALVKSVGDGMRVIRDQAAINVHQSKSAMIISSKLNKGTGGLAVAELGLNKKKWYLIFKQLGTTTHEIVAGQATRKRIARHARKGWKWKGGVPIPAKVLADVGKGIVFGKKATIPGKPPTYWLSKAFDSKLYAAIDRMKEVLGEQIDKLWSGRE